MFRDIFVYVTPLPDGVNEMVAPCFDGYTVYINSNLNREQQIEAYAHAIGHIDNADWSRVKVQEIETRAHKKCPGQAHPRQSR